MAGPARCWSTAGRVQREGARRGPLPQTRAPWCGCRDAGVWRARRRAGRPPAAVGTRRTAAVAPRAARGVWRQRRAHRRPPLGTCGPAVAARGPCVSAVPVHAQRGTPPYRPPPDRPSPSTPRGRAGGFWRPPRRVVGCVASASCAPTAVVSASTTKATVAAWQLLPTAWPRRSGPSRVPVCAVRPAPPLATRVCGPACARLGAATPPPAWTVVGGGDRTWRVTYPDGGAYGTRGVCSHQCARYGRHA